MVVKSRATSASVGGGAGEGQEAVQPAAVTPQAREGVGENAAPEERPKLVLHESRQAGPVRPVGRLAQGGLDMLANDDMEHGVLGVSGPIRGLCKHHPLGCARRASAPMPRDGYMVPLHSEGGRAGTVRFLDGTRHRKVKRAFGYALDWPELKAL